MTNISNKKWPSEILSIMLGKSWENIFGEISFSQILFHLPVKTLITDHFPLFPQMIRKIYGY